MEPTQPPGSLRFKPPDPTCNWWGIRWYSFSSRNAVLTAAEPAQLTIAWRTSGNASFGPEPNWGLLAPSALLPDQAPGVIGGVAALALLVIIGFFAAKGAKRYQRRNLRTDGGGAGGLPQTAPRGEASAAGAAPNQVLAQRSFGVLGADKAPANKVSRAAGLFARLTGKRATPEAMPKLAAEQEEQFQVNPRNPLAVPQCTVVPIREPQSPVSPTAITVSDAGAPAASAAGSSSQIASNGSGSAERMYVNPLTRESISSGSDGLVATNEPFAAGIDAGSQMQAKRLRRNEGPLAAPSSPVTTNGSFRCENRALGLSQDADFDTLLLSEAGSPHAIPHMNPAVEASSFEVGNHPAHPLGLAAADAGAAAVLQTPPGFSQWDMDSSSMDLSSLHNDWFETFSEGSRIKHLQTDQISVDGDRSEDGSLPMMTTQSSIEPPSPSGAGKGYRRPGTLLEIAARDQARSTRSFIKRHETMMKDALASLSKPNTVAGPTTAAAAPIFAQGLSGGHGQATSKGVKTSAHKEKKKATASKGVADLKDTANGDWEYLLMQKDSNMVHDAIRRPGADTPTGTHLLQHNPATTHFVPAASGNPFSSYRPSSYVASGPQRSMRDAMYGDEDDLTLDNPLLYDAPISDRCDTETTLSGSSAARPGMGGVTRNPMPPGGDLFWKTFQAMEEDETSGAHWPKRSELETSGTMTSMFGTHNLSLTSTIPSDGGHSLDVTGPGDMSLSEVEPSVIVQQKLRGCMGVDEGTLLERTGGALDGSAVHTGDSIHDSLSTLPRERVERKQQPIEPNPAILTMRNMA
ncbi:hypothetical protein WJX74_009189 [Apatococcus lobatus]|uniref:Uncharacterized protein n=1 Tax=Apatococcus lobatus TaxID=904363 RepID=A0AAW1RYM3_9CHLO